MNTPSAPNLSYSVVVQVRAPSVKIATKHMTDQLSSSPLLSPGSPNPFFEEWRQPFGVPPFGRIAPEHFLAAFEQAFAAHDAEIAAITADSAEPTFDNTILALERSGKALQRVSRVFGALTGAHSNDALRAIEREISPRNARHWNGVLLSEPLFRRIAALYQKRDALGLDAERMRVLDRYRSK